MTLACATWRRGIRLPGWLPASGAVVLGAVAGVLLSARLVAAADGGPSAADVAGRSVFAPVTEMAGLVTDLAGVPLPGIMVFAVDARTDRVASMAVSNDAGRVILPVARGRHNVGVVSASFGVARLVPRGATGFDLVLQPRPALPAALSPEGDAPGGAARVSSATAFVLRGRTVDETGVGLEGSQIQAVRGEGPPVTSAISGKDGRFAMGLPGGTYVIRVYAPGFRTSKLARQNGEVVLVMAIAAEPQRVDIAGNSLTFRLQDSIDPEYTPPAKVRAWLQIAYGICGSSNPLRAHERRALKKYWYLDVLRTAPPNPATISTANCAPPSQYQRMPWSRGADFVMLPDGFGYSEDDPGREAIDPPR